MMETKICHVCQAINGVLPDRSTTCGRCGHPVYPSKPSYNIKALNKIKNDFNKKTRGKLK